MKKHIILISVIFIVSSCGNSYDSKDGYLEVTGRIDGKMVRNISKNIHRINSIIITSQGGDVSSAIDLGKLIYDNKIDVKVRKYCLSACAQYILPSANSVYFIGMPILGVHQSPTSIGEFYSLNGILVDNYNYKLTQKEKLFYRYIKLNTDISTEPLHYLDVMCHAKKDGRPAVGSKWSFLVPAPSTYRRWIGKDFSGQYAYGKLELYNSGRKYLPPTVSFTMIQEHEATRREFTNVGKCVPD